MKNCPLLGFLLLGSFLLTAAHAQERVPHYIWLEAETFGPLNGGNFSFQHLKDTTRGSWSVAGPGVAPEWTMGGESEWMSIAARPDETNEVKTSHAVEVPAAGSYHLWVRYMDYRQKEESFGVRVKQGEKIWSHIFGVKPVVDELDSMMMLWNFSFAWDQANVELTKGPAEVTLFTTGPTQVRRCVDCLCLTTDTNYRPSGRDKPDFAVWRVLRKLREAGTEKKPSARAEFPSTWKIADAPPAFVWNTGRNWLDQLRNPETSRVETPFEVDPPLLTNFIVAFRGQQPAVYSDPFSGPALNISHYPNIFTNGSTFTEWLERHPEKRFVMLLNYSEPNWPKNPDKAAVYANFKRFEKQFIGYIAGESIAHASTDGGKMEKRVKAAKSRGEILEALHEMHTASVVKKFTDYNGKPMTPEEAWAPIISCLSGNMESYAHALCHWGVKRLGHENTGNSPTLARRLAFMRGAARQFGARIVNYQSCNLGDAATMYSRQAFLYPASSKFIWDNSYDAWAGAGHHWLLKDYLLWYLAGVDAYYNEQGVDMFWKPGGNVAGDSFPVELSPKGRTAEAFMKISGKHPRGNQFTPVAIFMDEAHGWSQERFHPGGFQLDPELNLALLKPGKHEAAIRGMFDIAYYPAPETQNEAASAIRQTFVSGIFGDIFDVIVNAADHTKTLSTYPITFAAGEVPISAEWGDALLKYMQQGGTFVAAAEQLSGPGVEALGLPKLGALQETDAMVWNASGESLPSQVYRYYAIASGKDKVLAKSARGEPVIISRAIGKGMLVFIATPLGIGLDERPIPGMALLMRQLSDGLMPVRVKGEVEWTLDKLSDGGWLVGLFNNRGVIKPQHGVLPTNHREVAEVELEAGWPIAKSTEWVTETVMDWQGGERTKLTLPAGAVRLVAIYPK
ncbi:MAG TPA: hypothetical protein VGE41_06305 [Verrucomicrobiae bacterium]